MCIIWKRIRPILWKNKLSTLIVEFPKLILELPHFILEFPHFNFEFPHFILEFRNLFLEFKNVHQGIINSMNFDLELTNFNLGIIRRKTEKLQTRTSLQSIFFKIVHERYHAYDFQRKTQFTTDYSVKNGKKKNWRAYSGSQIPKYVQSWGR